MTLPFLPTLTAIALIAAPHREATAVFGGGCFWGVEAVFEHVRGVTSVVSGYAGGTTANPSYHQVGTGTTGHVEAVRVRYDPDVISYRQLLEIFFLAAHDPTQGDGQGPDIGAEYRPVVFVGNPAERDEVERYVVELGQRRVFRAPIVTQRKPFTTFYLAEEYHQDYAARHPDDPYIVVNDAPKLERLRRAFPSLYREAETGQR